MAATKKDLLFFFLLKIKLFLRFSGSFPLILPPQGFWLSAAPQAWGCDFISPRLGSWEDASQPQLCPATSAHVTGPLLNCYQFPAEFPPPVFPRRPQISPGPQKGLEDVTGCSDSWFLSRLEKLLFHTGNYFVLHSVFCSTLPVWAGVEFLAGVKP